MAQGARAAVSALCVIVVCCSRYGTRSTCRYGWGRTRSLWHHVTVVWLSQLSTPSHCTR